MLMIYFDKVTELEIDLENGWDFIDLVILFGC